jgi:hypothetical protein
MSGWSTTSAKGPLGGFFGALPSRRPNPAPEVDRFRLLIGPLSR